MTNESSRPAVLPPYKGGTYTMLYVARSSEARDEQSRCTSRTRVKACGCDRGRLFKELVRWPDGIERRASRRSKKPTDLDFEDMRG